MRFQTQILSEAEQERIHQSSLRILEEVGVRYLGAKALPLLARYGAQVDWDEKIARIPAALVEQCLATMPKSFVLGARNPLYDYPLPSNESRFGIDGTAAFTLDFTSGQRRYGLRQDIMDSLRIFQTLELGRMAWAPTCASDIPAAARALAEFFAMASACSKHGQHELHTIGQTPYLIEGLAAIMGSEAALKEKKCFSLIYCPVAPLSHDGEMLDAYLELGQWDLPVTSLPMPICGTTGPASLFGNLCLANAENLSSVVIFQLNNPGRPLMMGSSTGVVDFLSGAYLGGVAEMGLMSAGMTTMAKFYGAPSCAAGVTADAKATGAEAVLQKFSTTLPPAAMNSDLIIGYGAVEGDQLLVLEQLIVDEEIAQWCRRLTQGIDSSEGKDLFGDIKQVGPGGHFLRSKNTRLAPRSGEFLIDRLMPRGSYESWTEAGKPDIYLRARQRVSEILAGPVLDPLPEAVSAKLDEIVRRAATDLQYAHP